MSADRRWAGGIANRTWERGVSAGHVVDVDQLKADVRAYLADCRTAPWLDPKYHPTAAGAVKAIHHHTPAEADIIRSIFHRSHA